MINKQNFIKLFQKYMMCKLLLKYMMCINYHNLCIKNHLIYIVLLGMIKHTSFQITRREKHKNCISRLKSLCMLYNLQNIMNKYLIIYLPNNQFHIDQLEHIFLIINRILDHILCIGYLKYIIHKYQGTISIFQIVNIFHQHIQVHKWFLLINILLDIHYTN